MKSRPLLTFFTVVAPLLVLQPAQPFARALSTHPTVVLIAVDGIAHRNVHLGHSPTLQALLPTVDGENGGAEWMLPQFPARTLPNLHSIATGLYPEYHGVVGDRMLAATVGAGHQCLGYDAAMYERQQTVTPIWTLNEMSGDNRHSAVIQWPGAEFHYGKQPLSRFQLNITDCVNWTERVDYAVRHITKESDAANLVLLRLEANQTRANQPIATIMREIDDIIDYYFQQLEKAAIRDKVNTIIVSDHSSTYRSLDVTPQCGRAARRPALLENCLVDIEEDQRQAMRQLNAFKTEQCAQIKYNFEAKMSQMTEHFLNDQEDKIFVHPTRFLDAIGNYNHTSDAFPLFIAQGPLFAENVVLPPFENVDIYALISHVLNLTQPATPINGSMKGLQNILKSKDIPVYNKGITKAILFTIVAVLVLGCMWYIVRMRRRERLRL